MILAVDTSYIAVGYYLCQADSEDTKKRSYNRFGSITLNDRERRFSQPKLEVYGLFRSLRALRLYVIGVRNLVIEVDARYIKGMLQNPDIVPSASINRWIVSILTFHFTLVHVPGHRHGPDGLSRRPRQPGDLQDESDDDAAFEDWIDNLYGFLHFINPIPYLVSPNPISIFAQSATSDNHNDSEPPRENYSIVPRSEHAKLLDSRLALIPNWLETLQRPPTIPEGQYAAFVKYATQFFTVGNKLWHKNPLGNHQVVIFPSDRLRILHSCHDLIGHRGIFATRSILLERFWWPFAAGDIAWYVKTCHMCQVRQKRHVLAPPIVATPAPLFTKVHMDSMRMPRSGGFSILVQARCALCTYPEARRLRAENGTTLGTWIYEDILCRWGAISEIVSDNGSAFVKALEYLSATYHINHIRISGYNSRANGLVERPHFDMRQALFKAADGDQSRWSQVLYSVLWSERITIRRRMGVSPYFAATGTHPLTPLDISEATYLLPPPNSILTTEDLISRRAIALQKRDSDLAHLHDKVLSARLEAARRFEKEHRQTIRDFNFTRGSLVLVRHTQIEKSLNRKMRPRYLGPLIVVSRNRGGAYILAELDGTVFDRPFAAFRVIPYFARQSLPIPADFGDVGKTRIEEMADSDDQGDDEDTTEE